MGLKINLLKCAIMTPDSNAEIEIDNNVVPKVSKFKFLGSLVPDCSSDVQRQSQAFGRLKTIWSSKDVSMHLKTRLYGALILPIDIYGSESWTTRRKEIDALRGVGIGGQGGAAPPLNKYRGGAVYLLPPPEKI